MTHDTAGPRLLKTSLTISVRNQVSGFVYDPGDLSTRFVVELMADGLPIGLYRADGFVPALGEDKIGDGCYGFATVLSDAVAFGAGVIEARLANSGEPVGAILRPASARGREEAADKTDVRWVSGLRLQGWLEELPGKPPRRVRALIDGVVVAETTPSGWTQITRGDDVIAARAFVLDLPSRYADGKARIVEVLAGDGTALAGSPCAFVAFADGLEGLIDRNADLESERVRAHALDRLLPQSWPLTDVARWQDRFPQPKPAEASGPPIAVVLVGERDVEASLASLEAQVNCSWTAACLPGNGHATSFVPDDLIEFLEGDAAASEIIVFAPAGTRFSASALGLFRDALAGLVSAQSAYCDLLMPGPAGPWPLAFPAFDYELCLERGYCGLVFAMRHGAGVAAAKAGAGSLIRQFLSQFDTPLDSGAEPLHLPVLLAAPPFIEPTDLQAALKDAAEAHFRMKRLDARLLVVADAAFPSIRVTRAPEPGRVSIIIPTRNRADLLTACLNSLERTIGDGLACEVVIADNDSTDTTTLEVLANAERQGLKIVRVPGSFNVSKINNRAAAVATGPYLLLLNTDIKALEAGWLEEMLSRIAEPDVGAVGPMLLWPSGIVQSAGIVLGPGFEAAHAFGDRMGGEPGYGGLLQSAHECSALSGACLLTRKDLYLSHGGFDETHFAIDYGDIDYCLKLRASGYRILVTPHARVRNAGAATRGHHHHPDQKERQVRERDGLRLKWGEVLGADPYYNPNLTLGGSPYSGLAWPPRSAHPRQPNGRAGRHLPVGI